MSGPITRPIRDDRPRGLDGRLLDYAAPDESRGNAERKHHQKQESSEPSNDSVRNGPIWTALLAMVPDRFRPAAKILLGCTMCLLIAGVYLVGSVEWHYVPLWSPRTAAAEDLRKTDARVAALEQASAMSLRIQQRQRMMALQDIICLTGDVRLRLELQEIQFDYRRLNGADYQLPPCKSL